MKKMSLLVSQVLIGILTFVFLYVSLHGPSASSASFDQVQKATIKGWDLNTSPVQDNLSIKRNLKLDPSLYEAIAYYKNSDPMQADELVLVKFKEIGQGQDFKKSLDERLASQEKIFKGYAPKEAAKLSKGIVDLQANFALYVVSDKAEVFVSQFEKGLR